MAVVVASSVLLLGSGSAQAASGTFRDSRGDAAAKVDVTRVDVRYTQRRIAVRLHIRDFPGTSDARNGYEVWIDSGSTTDKGPDYYMALMSQELYAGRTRGWDMLPGKVPGTSYTDPYGSIRVFWSQSRAKNWLELAVPTKSIRSPAKVRVAVKVHRWGPGGAVLSRDHLGSRHHFTGWVAR